MRYKSPAAIVAALAIVAVVATPAYAADLTWSGGADPVDDFSAGANWVGGIAPAGNDNLTFPEGATGTATNTVAGFDVTSMTFDAELFAVTGARIDLFGGLLANGNATIGAPLGIEATQSLTVYPPSSLSLGDVIVAAGANLTFNSEGDTVVNGTLSGTTSAHKQGDGVLFLNGSSTIPTVSSGGAAVHSGSVGSSDMLILGGYLSGGPAAGNDLGLLQNVGDIILDGSLISPGPSAYGPTVGTFHGATFTGSVESTYEVDIDGLTSDKIATSGQLNPMSTLLDISVTNPAAVGTVYVIADAVAESQSNFSSTTGTLDDDEEFVSNGHRFRIDYATTQVRLTYLGAVVAAPEPALPATPGPALPATGSDPGPTIVLGGFLLLMGAGAAVVATRRREAL